MLGRLPCLISPPHWLALSKRVTNPMYVSGFSNTSLYLMISDYHDETRKVRTAPWISYPRNSHKSRFHTIAEQTLKLHAKHDIPSRISQPVPHTYRFSSTY